MARRRHHRCGALGKKSLGGLIVAGVAGIAVGAYGYYMYLASKSGATAGTGLISVRRA